MDALDKFLLFGALPFVVVASLIEAFFLSRKSAYDWRASGVSILDLFLRVGLQIFLPLSIATPFIVFAYKHRLTTIDVSGWQIFLALFIGQEFCYYWYHRAAHRVRWFWANHAVHHSPNALNLTAAVRIGILGRASGTALFFLPLVWFGFPPKLAFQLLSLNLLYQFWIHATWIPKLGFLEGWINTPSAHRVHHANNLDYLDANYGGVLLVFDRLFGTYKPERNDLPCTYGWVQPIHSYNPLRIEFTQWARLFRDVFAAKKISHAFLYIVKPPGWAPDGKSNTTEDMRRRGPGLADSG